MNENNFQKSGAISGSCSHDSTDEYFLEQKAIQKKMSLIKNKILILSGKGGVGKSTVAANLAMSLSLAGKKVGLLDIDIHGPSIPHLLGLTDQTITGADDNLKPVEMSNGLKVMSIGFLLQNQQDAVIWRGPRKYHMIKQFLMDVDWGELDYIIVDSPPGTGDEPLAIAQLMGKVEGAVVVTTPQEVSTIDVSKCITFCRHLDIPITGIIENMSGFICPHCDNKIDIFKKDGGKTLAFKMQIPFLGEIPIDPDIVTACDSGQPYIFNYSHSDTAKAFGKVVLPILKMESSVPVETEIPDMTDKNALRIAIPLANEKLSMHFGHCDNFALIDVDPKAKEIVNQKSIDAPPHQPGLLPRWLHEQGANMIIAGGMGARAQELFAQNDIKVIIGAPSETPERLVKDLLEETLSTGDNICDH